jgi:hypothetical protein
MRRAVLVLGMVLAVPIASLAVAGSSNLGTVGGFTYVSDFAATDGPLQQVSGSVKCPGGTRVVGGGGSLPWNGFQAHLNGLYPKDGPDAGPEPDDAFALRAWRGSTGGGPQASDVYAICRSGNVAYRRASEEVAAGHTGLVQAACPAGKHASGGGVRLSGKAKQAFINSSYPFDGSDANPSSDDGWRARVYNLSGASKRVTAYAFCVHRTFDYWVGGNSFGASPTRDTQTTCPDGHLAGPGVELSGPAGRARPSAVYPHDSQIFHTDADSIPDDETATSGANLEGGDKAIFAWAVCTR